MEPAFNTSSRTVSSGFSLLEMLFVLSLLSICAVVGCLEGARALAVREAKGAAQGWQAGVAWAQIGALWHGGKTELVYETDGSVVLLHDLDLVGRGLGARLPAVPVTSNVRRWVAGNGATVSFGGPLASPDSGGSLYFGSDGDRYRVVVRPESGLTVRDLSEAER